MNNMDGKDVPKHFHLLSFEGPDAYARAGGIASRVTGLAESLVEHGHRTSLWFVGDPELPGCEIRAGVRLRRWCQWISRYHPAGVYDAEDAKCADYATSLPPYLLNEEILPALAEGVGRIVVLAEEWQTVHAVLHLDWLLRRHGVRDRVSIFWNANNTFGFDRVDWPRLAAAATLVTVSRYMKQQMRAWGVDPLVIPNGLARESFAPPCSAAVNELCQRFRQRTLLTKVARWDPDKRWLLTIDTVALLKREGRAPLLVARGGVEAHEREVLVRARSAGLRISERHIDTPDIRSLLAALADHESTDLLVLRTHLTPEVRSLLFRAADAVLANSAHEPFGLVGLEAMAVGGLACTGASGEDYAVDGENALVLQREDPREFFSLFARLQSREGRAAELRRSGMRTAQLYAWERVVERSLLPRI